MIQNNSKQFKDDSKFQNDANRFKTIQNDASTIQNENLRKSLIYSGCILAGKFKYLRKENIFANETILDFLDHCE